MQGKIPSASQRSQHLETTQGVIDAFNGYHFQNTEAQRELLRVFLQATREIQALKKQIHSVQ